MIHRELMSSGQMARMYLGESERWRCWGELQVLVLVGVSCIQDERNHIVLPRLHFHGYCGLRGVHSYPAQENSFLKNQKLAPNKWQMLKCFHILHITMGRYVQRAQSRESLLPPCVLPRVCVLLWELNEAAAASSESSGVGSGGGNWMLVRSGREPPVLWAAGFTEVVSCCSGDGKMLRKNRWVL